MKRVLVTGATGFVGRQCLAPLADLGFEVHAIARNFGVGNVSPQVHCHALDLLGDPSRLDGLVAELACSHLLHLAWITQPGKYWTSPENLRWLAASLRLVEIFARNGGRRLVVSGSCGEVDWANPVIPDGPVLSKPRTLYGWCKLSLYFLLAAYAAQANLSLGWGRLFFMYGPHEHPGRLVPAVINALIKKEPVRCSHGRQVRDFLAVDDVALALVKLLDSAVEGPVNIVSGETHTIAEVIRLIADLFGSEPLIHWGAIPSPSDEPLQLVGEPHRLREEVLWSPRFTLAQGLEQTISWWRNQMGN